MGCDLSAIRREIRATLALAAPLAGANLAQIAMGLTNAVVVGHLGGEALAAAGLGGGLYFTLVIVSQGVLTAVAPLAAHAIGADDHAAAGRIAGAGMALAALLAAPVLALLTGVPYGLARLGYDAALTADISRYLMAARWAAPAFLAFVVLRAMLSAMARVRPIMVVLLLGVAANAALNWALVFGHCGLPALGIAGSGCAVAIVQWLMTAGLAAYSLLWPAHRRLRFHRRVAGHFGPLVRLGVPISAMLALETGLFSATGVLMGLFGAVALAGHQLALNFASIAFMVPLGIGQATTVRVAVQLGARDHAAARRAGLVALGLAGVAMLPSAALMLAAPRLVAGLYLDVADPANAAPVALGVRLLAIAAAFQVFDGLQAAAAGALRGYRDTTVPMAFAAIGYWGAGFGGGWALAFPLGYGAVGLWAGLALGLAVVAVLLSCRLYRRSSFAPAPLSVVMSG